MSYVPYVIIVDDFPDHPNPPTREIIGPFVTKYLAERHIEKHLQVPRIAWEIVPLTSQFDTERHTAPLTRAEPETVMGWQAYHGYSYPTWLLDNAVAHWLWKRLCCSRGWHLWDEVGSFEDYLFCDACEISFPDDAAKRTYKR